MGRPAATPEQRRAQRSKIRRAAAELTAEDGIGAISVRAIAKRAGISTGAVYSHFTNLSELMQSLWQEPVARAGAELSERANAEPVAFERIRVVLEFYAAFALDRPDFLRGAMLYVRPGTAPLGEAAQAEDLHFYAALLAAIEAAQADGTVRNGDPVLLAQTTWATLHGALALPVNLERWNLIDARTLASSAIEASLRALAP